jgi:hypothetical protein
MSHARPSTTKVTTSKLGLRSQALAWRTTEHLAANWKAIRADKDRTPGP